MNLERPDIRRLERSYYRRVELAILVAFAIHAAAMLLAPPYVPRPYTLDEPPLRLVMAASGPARVGAPAGRSEAPLPAPAGRTRAAVVARELRFAPQAAQRIVPTEAVPEPGAGRGASAVAGAPGGAGEAALEGSAPEAYYAFDSPPKVVRRIVPEYPAAAKSGAAEGTVVLNANVDERGRVIRVWVVQATAPEILIQAATDAMYRFEFTPGSSHGNPVKCTVAVPFNFRLNLHL